MIDSRTILGIDPGTNILGFGVIRIDERKHPQFVDAGVLDLRKESDPYVKLEKIHQFVSRQLYKSYCNNIVILLQHFF